MTTGPEDGKVTDPAGGPDGMPAALRLSEWLGIAVRCLRGWLWRSKPSMRVDSKAWHEALMATRRVSLRSDGQEPEHSDQPHR